MRGHLGAWSERQIDEVGRWHHLDERHLDGRSARRWRWGALYLSPDKRASASPVDVEVTIKAYAESTGTENDNDQMITRLNVGEF